MTTTVFDTVLEAKVAARNKVNALALEMAPKMIEALRPFVGKKVVNGGGGLCAKVRACLPNDEYGNSTQFWYSANNYSIYAYFKVCELSKGRLYGKEWNGQISDDCIGNYSEQTIPLCGVEGLNLKELRQVPELRTDFTVAEVQASRIAYEAAYDAMRKAESNLNGFGKYDN